MSSHSSAPECAAACPRPGRTPRRRAHLPTVSRTRSYSSECRRRCTRPADPTYPSSQLVEIEGPPPSLMPPAEGRASIQGQGSTGRRVRDRTLIPGRASGEHLMQLSVVMRHRWLCGRRRPRQRLGNNPRSVTNAVARKAIANGGRNLRRTTASVPTVDAHVGKRLAYAIRTRRRTGSGDHPSTPAADDRRSPLCTPLKPPPKKHPPQ